MPPCVAFDCHNVTGKGNRAGSSFHSFPLKNPHILKQWVTNINWEGFTPTEHSCICSDHFTEESYKGAVYLAVMGEKQHSKRRLKDAVPTIFTHKRTPAGHSCPHTEQ